MVLLTLKAVATRLKKLVFAIYNKTTANAYCGPVRFLGPLLATFCSGQRKVALLCAPFIWVPCTFFRPSPPLFSSYNPAPARRLVGDGFFTSAVFGLRLTPQFAPGARTLGPWVHPLPGELFLLHGSSLPARLRVGHMLGRAWHPRLLPGYLRPLGDYNLTCPDSSSLPDSGPSLRPVPSPLTL